MSPLYNFIVLSVGNFILTSFLLNPCSVPLEQRLDCGYPGIEPGTCMALGKLSLVLRSPWMLARLLIILAGSVTASMFMFRKSGFPSVVAVAYIAIGLMTFFTATRCCHDSTVPSGPHCYY